ncbi:MAG: hypothetical protein NUV74_09815, partial [Candidatus Brocadiaceae bacterium]|nr:hypothetical protein [Candidatus Brocadiaceae bacterium]
VHFPDCGSPQGGTISPVIANIFLHHVLDEWYVRVREKITLQSLVELSQAYDFAHLAKMCNECLKTRRDWYNQACTNSLAMLQFILL